jgi:hypothetical protein
MAIYYRILIKKQGFLGLFAKADFTQGFQAFLALLAQILKGAL